jgi:hypothetical protein
VPLIGTAGRAKVRGGIGGARASARMLPKPLRTTTRSVAAAKLAQVGRGTDGGPEGDASTVTSFGSKWSFGSTGRQVCRAGGAIASFPGLA